VKRRDFLAASCLASTVPLTAMAAADPSPSGGNPQYFEFRGYNIFTGPKKRLVGDFLKNVQIPALNRLGIGPIGVFNVKYGENKPWLYVLLPHPSLESVVTLSERLLADATFVESGAEFLDAPVSDPAYIRVESSLRVAFDGMPQLQVPTQTAENKPRIFELRTYESRSIKVGKKKIEMFHEGGEIAIFKNVGMQPVFFSERLIGPKLPCLDYMLAFDDMAARDAAWGRFSADPDWHKLRQDPQYADTVSNITDIILRPTGFSQI